MNPSSQAITMHESVFIISKDDILSTKIKFLVRSEGITCRSFTTFSGFSSQFHQEQAGCILLNISNLREFDQEIFVSMNNIDCHMPVIVIGEQPSVAMAIHVLKAGAFDFIESLSIKDCLISKVLEALRAYRIKKEYNTWRAEIDKLYRTLTDRESEVLIRIFHGMSNKEAANSLGISARTVEIYRSNIMCKMKSKILAELVRTLCVWDENRFSDHFPHDRDKRPGRFVTYANRMPRIRAVG